MDKLLKMIKSGCSAEEIAERARQISESIPQGQWKCVANNFWIRNDDGEKYSAIMIYPKAKGYYLLYKFEIDLSLFDEKSLLEYDKACPPPENIISQKTRKAYSIFMSLPLSAATDKCATNNEEIKDIWLKKHGVIGG